MFDFFNENADAFTAFSTFLLLTVTAFYAWTTYKLLAEAEITRLLSNEPHVVAFLRANEAQPNIVQLHIANLSGAAATEVSASIEKRTEWPVKFDLQDSNILRDISFMRPHELLKFDLGIGHTLFDNEIPAEFCIAIKYSSLDRRRFSFERPLSVASVMGFGNWKIYGIDDIARRLKDIADILKNNKR